MPLDFAHILQEIKKLGAALPAHQQDLEARRERARAWLDELSQQTDRLRNMVEDLAETLPNLRCACPWQEALDAHYSVSPAAAAAWTLIAADGSQIYPDRHAAIPFSLINIGAIVMSPDSPSAPETPLSSEIRFDPLDYAGGTLPSEGLLSLERDLRERQFLLTQVQKQAGPCIALSDGPLELWGGKDPQAAAHFAQAQEDYRRILTRLHQEQVIVAGYVDKPGANLVVRLLEAAHFHDEPSRWDTYHPLAGVSDRWLFGERGHPILKGGERSAIFRLQSKSAAQYPGPLAIYFFYLNVGDERHPWPVRVEIPRWVAEEKAYVQALQAALVQQAKMMGARPYPYVLHRAHEIALIKNEEKYQIEHLLANELRRHAVEMDEVSAKQNSKNVSAPGTRRTYP